MKKHQSPPKPSPEEEDPEIALANEYEHEDKPVEALMIYQNVMEQLMDSAEYVSDRASSASLNAKCQRLRPHSEVLKKKVDSMYSPGNLAKHFTLSPAKPQIATEVLAKPKTLVDTLRENVVLPAKLPQLFLGRSSPGAILLYGPPVSGKTFLVNAIAGEAGAKILSVDLNTLREHDRPGQFLHEIFMCAAAHLPCVLLFENVEALSNERRGSDVIHGEKDWSFLRIVRRVFILEIDGYSITGNCNSSRPHGLFVIATTRAPWMVDPAIRRVLARRLYVPESDDEEVRANMLADLLSDVPAKVSKKELDEIAKLTSAYSRDELQKLVQFCLIDQMNARVGKIKEGAMKAAMKEVTKQDIVEMMKRVRASVPRCGVPKHDTRSYDQWTHDFT